MQSSESPIERNNQDLNIFFNSVVQNVRMPNAITNESDQTECDFKFSDMKSTPKLSGVEDPMNK